MAKYNIYGVAKGINLENGIPVYNMICHTWKEAEQYIKGVADAKYKGFLTESEAKAWFLSVNPDMMVDNKKPKDLPGVAERKKINAEKIDTAFTATCMMLGISEEKVMTHLKENFIVEYNFMNNRVRQQ